MQIRRGLPEDLPAIAAIQSASPEASQWNPADYLAYELRVAEFSEGVAGFLVVRVVGDEAEILNLAVAPELRRRGVARALLRSLFGVFRGAVFLEVRESNRAARYTYQALGFQEVTRRENYYDLPPEAAIVLKFHSC
jgi:[ribosomal protein S18]-alanine N-acetyltransferase